MLTLIVLGFGCALALWSRDRAEAEDRKFYEGLKKKQMEAIMRKLREDSETKKAP